MKPETNTRPRPKVEFFRTLIVALVIVGIALMWTKMKLPPKAPQGNVIHSPTPGSGM